MNDAKETERNTARYKQTMLEHAPRAGRTIYTVSGEGSAIEHKFYDLSVVETGMA